MSDSPHPYRPRRQRRRWTAVGRIQSWWRNYCCYCQQLMALLPSSSKKSSSTLLLNHGCSNGAHNNNNNNNNNSNNNGSSSSSSTISTNIQILLLCLFGIILVLLTVIAYLVVLLIEPSTVRNVGTYRRSPFVTEGILQHNTPLRTDTAAPLSASKNPIHNDESPYSNTSTDVRLPTTTASNRTKIVWLMSFPNSGTSYTSRLVRDVTRTFTASNYADETPEGLLGEHVPVYPNETYGPFWTVPMANAHDYRYPTEYVLTKTHCGIRCSLCSPNEYAETTYSFRRRCLVTKWVERTVDGHAPPRTTNVYSTYPVTHVGQAVHLIRNPFDNVVSRFHLEHAHPNRTANEYSPDRHGFLRYCLSIDYKYIQQEIKYLHFQENKLLQDLWLVPCHADFMRYIEWHNLAFITTSDLHIPTYILQYDWYTTRYEQVTTELLQFLHLTPVAEPPPFVPGKVYDQYYTTKEKLIVKRAFEFMASSTTWDHLRHYFPPDP